MLKDNCAKAGVPREMPQESMTLMCLELFRKEFFYLRKRGKGNRHLQFDSIRENRSHAPEVCLSLLRNHEQVGNSSLNSLSYTSGFFLKVEDPSVVESLSVEAQEGAGLTNQIQIQCL